LCFLCCLFDAVSTRLFGAGGRYRQRVRVCGEGSMPGGGANRMVGCEVTLSAVGGAESWIRLGVLRVRSPPVLLEVLGVVAGGRIEESGGVSVQSG
jgi:hypothetical protein